ncbi:MAG: 16S rRNA (adenine(1518)-N(6)/adenine(1519)-N(6))-dimethyltransferase RsmA, partial [Eggerthellaceae bacterium]|nr:16S rRNA (adenine(1518)-N(6)/adenine(1519)-N(6))-dimethyltransferase RsmA [Eggerthellaceae bacterium]
MFSPYANIGATRDVLQQFDMHTTKILGQNFLVNDNVVGHILALANISSDDIVLEVGPGIGTLTYALCNSAGQVVAIERDMRLPRVLEHTLASCDNFTLVSADALSYDISKLHKQPTMLVANLPYAVAATLVLKYFQEIGSLQSATVMVQKEVALRMAACPGNKNYGAYTVKLSLYA